MPSSQAQFYKNSTLFQTVTD